MYLLMKRYITVPELPSNNKPRSILKKGYWPFFYAIKYWLPLMLMKNFNEAIVAVEFVNRERNIINFVRDESLFGFFHYDPNTLKPKIGDMLKIKYAPKTKDDKLYKVLSIQPASQDDTCPAIKSYQGKISITNKNGFGFVDDVFFFPKLVKKFSLENDQEIVGMAILSYDKKKGSWGWKPFKIIV